MPTRLHRALEIVHGLSKALDLEVAEPKLLCDSNHVTLRLNADIVARVLLDASDESAACLERECEICRQLAERGAPVTQPTVTPDPGPHRFGSDLVTFWQYVEVFDQKVDLAEAAIALQHVHEALRHCTVDLPHYWQTVDLACRELQSEAGRRFLAPGDHRFLTDLHGHLVHLKDLPRELLMPLHGACHLGNVINTPRGCLWLDFDTVCRGPVEWDLSCVPREASKGRVINKELMREIRRLRSWTTAVWCWAIYDHSEEKREAAHYHLARLNGQYPDLAG
jgi:hypothetical protein